MELTEQITKQRVKGNIGEWSEWYAFLKILTDGKMYAADSELNKIEENFFTVLSVIRDEIKAGRKIYDLSNDGETIQVWNEERVRLASIPTDTIKKKVREIFECMKAPHDTTFGSTAGDDSMAGLMCAQIKASNSQKADLTVVIHDRISPTETELGFSVKSMLGASATLLNASGATNFTYDIADISDEAVSAINAIVDGPKIRDRIEAINAMTGEAGFVFSHLANEKFKHNLRKIDTVFPEILATTLKYFFEGRGNTLAQLVQCLADDTALYSKFGLNKEDYEFKLKEFLIAVALGMTPSKEWDGFTKAHGGYIVVKEDGEIVCYHLYNRDEFQEYLFNNTRLDTPSSSRHNFGSLYRDENGLHIDLNLQIRFIR